MIVIFIGLVAIFAIVFILIYALWKKVSNWTKVNDFQTEESIEIFKNRAEEIKKK